MATGLHEEFAREERIAPASNKRFGLVVGAILLAFATSGSRDDEDADARTG